MDEGYPSFEGIFLGVLAVGALFWTLFTSFDDARDRDNSSYIFFALLPITAVLFLLGRFLSRKGYRLMGMSLLGLFWRKPILWTGGEYLSLFQGRTQY